MDYLTFLSRWYNWLYVAGIIVVLGTFFRLGVLERGGARLGTWLGVQRVAGRLLVRVFALTFAVVGLTVNGALHDYWPAQQERAFLPGLVVTVAVAAGATRWVGRLFQRHFPRIKAVGWGSPGLSGSRGRVVSRMISPDYRAGRAQVMGENETLHWVMCKTKEGEIAYGASVVLGQYDEEDGRYFVEERAEKDNE